MTRLFLCILLLLGCNASTGREASARPPSHELWDALLKKHVNADGRVDYQGFVEDKDELVQYLNALSSSAPDTSWSEQEQLAYWINAYNAFTVKLIVDNYPVESIKDLGPAISIPTIHTVWHKKFFTIGGKDTSLDEIEHDILRKQFNEPRIHFAINCASISCPVLRAEAYTAHKLEEQLENQAVVFINDPARNIIKADKAQLSRIFKWFKGDFEKNQTLIEFINRYAVKPLHVDATLEFLSYDWSLNEMNYD